LADRYERFRGKGQFYTLTMQAGPSAEMLAVIHQVTPSYFPQNNNIHSQRSENRKPHKINFV
jgi:hypothetical protein